MHRTESQLPASPRPHLSSRQTARVTANIREHSPPPDSRARVEVWTLATSRPAGRRDARPSSGRRWMAIRTSRARP